MENLTHSMIAEKGPTGWHWVIGTDDYLGYASVEPATPDEADMLTARYKLWLTAKTCFEGGDEHE